MSTISVHNYSLLENARRLDAEFYKPHLMTVIDFLRSKSHTKLGKENIIRSGTTPPDRDDSLKDGIVLLKTVDIQNGILPIKGDYYRISKEIDERMSKTRINQRDVLINIVGATLDVIGRVSFVPEGFETANITQAMALLRPKPSAKLMPEYLFSFLRTRYGLAQVYRTARPTGQYNLNLQELSGFIIPTFSNRFQNSIRKLVNISASKQSKSFEDYYQAEQILFSELGLQGWNPTPALTYIRSYSQASKSRRIDAEHFKPAYDELITMIQKQAECKTIRQIRAFNSRGTQPIYVESGKLRVINSKHILEQHLDYENLETTSDDYWNIHPESRVFENDILIYTTGANVGRTNIYLDTEKALASNHVNILRLHQENQVYVGFVLNSFIGRMQTRKFITGTAQAELYPSDIDKFVIPFIGKEKQLQISILVRDSLAAKRETKALLEKAKRAVEIAIEESEERAIEFIG